MSLTAGKAILLSSAAGGGYEVSRSLRFNSSDSAYLSRTPSSAGDRKKWTWAAWVKRSALSVDQSLFSAYTGSASDEAYTDFFFSSDNTLRLGGWFTTWRTTTQVFRDTSAWYHIVLAVDIANATANDRVKLYVNGAQVTTFSTTNNPATTSQFAVNSTNTHNIGANAYYTNTTNKFSGYIADSYFIDSQALDPTSFTEVSATTGQLIPKAYTGTFTGNSFWLKFADNSAATATTLGKDSSGLGNNWTPNNFSVSTSTTVYTNNFSISGTLFPGSSLANAFDGNIATSATVTNAAQNQTLTFAPSPGIAYTSGVEVYLTPTGDVSVTRYSFNGGADQSFAAGDGWKTVASGSGTLTSLVIKQGAQGNSVGISAIRINGTTILVDNAARNNDSLVDTPTSYGTDTGAGGEVRGNYATWNPLANGSAITLSNGNLDGSVSTGTGSNDVVFGTVGISSGKWYWEVTANTGSGGTYRAIGIGKTALNPDNGVSTGTYVYYGSGEKASDGGAASAYGASYTNGDVIGVAFDADAGTLTFYKNGTTQGTAFTGLTAGPYVALVGKAEGALTWTWNANFGQRQWAYAAPAGFKALCDTNLPAPVVAKPNTVFDAVTYDGNSSTKTVTGYGFSPDLVWIKCRNQAEKHALYDQVRGVKNILSSNLTSAEIAETNGLSSFNSDGYTLDNNGHINYNGYTYVGWAWDAGTTTSSNGSGSITSQVRANASAGFSIVTYTGNGSSAQTVGHGLGIAPSLVVVKKRSATDGWLTYFTGFNSNEYLYLNSTDAKASYSGTWGSTPTSTVFGVGDAVVNANGATFVAYCWAPVAGYSSFGSYTGNGSADGPFVFTGMRPRWLLWKRTDSTGAWILYDTARNTYNVSSNYLQPHLSNAEVSEPLIDILSNGFKVRVDGAYTGTNVNGATYVWAAFAESPFQYARAR